jgi:hypothetical protein
MELQAAIDTAASPQPHPDCPSTLTRDQVMIATESQTS